jgi:CheY-like chemotaxis protein
LWSFQLQTIDLSANVLFNAARRIQGVGMSMPIVEASSLVTVDGRFVLASRSYWNGKRDQPAVDTSAVTKTTAPKRVLIIEDNLDSVHALSLLVADMGHTVEYAINGYVGLEVARRFRPDVVLLDIGLPGLDGYEVCSGIKSDPELRQTRIVVVTAFAQDEYRVRSMAAGCELHLVKPVPIWVLEEVLG